MMDGWEYGLAKEFLNRDNPQPNQIGICIGTILSTDPWKVSIQNGQYMIDASNGYVCKHILARSSNYKAEQKQSGSMSVSCPHGGGSYSAQGTIEGHIDLAAIDDWKAGNKVMVAAGENNQYFFIVDIV